MKRYDVRVSAARALTGTTHAIRVERPAGFDFAAGQHVILQLETADGADDRFLSIASSPAAIHLEFAVRLSDSAFKRRFAALAEGDAVTMTGPTGRFRLNTERPALMISGGIGITPLRSMMQWASDVDLQVPITLLYANRDVAEIVFRDELDELARCHAPLRIVHHVDQPPCEGAWQGETGHITAETIAREADRLDGPTMYLCGPPGMVQAMQRHLITLDVPKQRIRREDFIGY